MEKLKYLMRVYLLAFVVLWSIMYLLDSRSNDEFTEATQTELIYAGRLSVGSDSVSPGSKDEV